MAYEILKWGHILTLTGLFGALLVIQFGLPVEVQDSYSKTKKANRVAGHLLLLGFLLGIALYGLKIKIMVAEGSPMESQQHMLVGIKMVCLVLIGAFMGVGSGQLRKGKHFTAGIFRLASLGLLALGAFLGVLVGAC